jgi:hypothetical protein
LSSDDSIAIDRRTLLASIGALSGTASVAGCSAFERGSDTSTERVDDDSARELAERFAPTLYFDTNEQWFPTDPRPYQTEQDGEQVVNGFDAFNGYVEAKKGTDRVPKPTLFYHAMQYSDSPLAVVQFWYYSAFDQFTTNFHWHDWEVLHVFVDMETGDPQLYVASSHSGRVPNNEFLDPDPDRQPRILSELGSHSSALSVNDVPDRFQRLPIDGTFADITNSAFEGIEDIADIPIAYGLPRDEGSRLPYVVPELAGKPVYEHEQLPAVERDDLIGDELTVRSFSDLTSPPSELPERETGLVFGFAGRGGDSDIEYDLIPTADLEDISSFTGPQLSFEFAIPEFAEDAVASHISTAGTPWEQPRYENPARDISAPNHRAELAKRYDAIGEPASVNTIVANITEAVTDSDAPENEGVTTQGLSVESIALLESEPDAVPSSGGIVVAQDIPEREHRLTINGPGLEPHSETVTARDDESGPTTAGVESEIPLVARENATKLEFDPQDTDAELTDLAIEDDFAGRLYDAPLSGPDAVYVHRGGAYTAEVRDADDEIGAARVNPSTARNVRVRDLATGKGSLAEYIADVSAETANAVSALTADADDTSTPGGRSGAGGRENAVKGLSRALQAVAETARTVAERAAAGERNRADESLAAVQTRLDRVSSRLTEAGGSIPEDLTRATERRLTQLDRRSKQAREAQKL